MPNRKRVIQVLTQDVVGAQVWNGLTGECRTMPTDDFHEVEDAMAAVLERTARAIDWPRLLREAAARHMKLHPDREMTDRDWSTATGVCGECLHEALLADDMGAPKWDEHPTSPREFQNQDWPSVVARHFPHRQAAQFHPFKEDRVPAPRATKSQPETASSTHEQSATNEQPTPAEDTGLFTVHCSINPCGHTVRRDTNDAADSAMDVHYRETHSADAADHTEHVSGINEQPECPAVLLPLGDGDVEPCLVKGKHDTHMNAAGQTWTDPIEEPVR